MAKFNSFEELGAAFGLKKKPRKEKLMVCKKCGGFMKHPAGTNVYLCENALKGEDGKVFKDENGKVKLCGNRVFTKYTV